MPSLRIAVVLLNDTYATVDVVVHELCHALVEHWTCGYPYPSAIREGFALLVGGRVTARIWRSSAKRAGAAGSLGIEPRMAEHLFMSIADQMSLRIRADEPCHAEDGRSPYDRIAYSTLWLAMFLDTARWKGSAVLRSVLKGLRDCDARTPDAAYQWLVRARGTSADELEEAYRAYCFAGKVDIV